MKITKEVKLIFDIFQKHNFEAFIVGGCVRDEIIGKKPKDYDFSTIATPDVVTKIFEDEGFEVVPTGIQHGTVSVIIDGEPYEITTYRYDGNYSDGRRPDEVIFAQDVKDDLARRDFTMNAIAYSNELGYVDPYDGKLDIGRKLITSVGKASDRFNEDALRMLRCLRFASVLDFHISPESLQAIYDLSETIKNVSIERVNVELSKAIMGKKPYMVIETMYDSRMLEYILGLQINIDKRYFFEMFDSKKVAISGLFVSDDKAKENVEELLKSLKFSSKEVKSISKIVQNIEFYSNSSIEIKEKIAELGIEDYKNLLEVKMRLEKAKTATIAKTYKLLKQSEDYYDQTLFRSQLALTGNDIMPLGFSGKEIRFVLEELLRFVYEDDTRNTKEILINKVVEMKGDNNE